MRLHPAFLLFAVPSVLHAEPAADPAVPPEIESLGLTPVPIDTPKPGFFPATAKSGVDAATVTLKVVVDKTGSVVSVRLLSGDDPFVNPALNHVRRWRYQPLVVDGRPIAWSQTVNIEFVRGGGTVVASGFGRRGTHELGFVVGPAGGRSSSTLDGERTGRGQNELQVGVVAGTFPASRVELQARLGALRSLDTEHRTELAAGIGAALFTGDDSALFGPQITASVASRSVSEERRTGRRTDEYGAGYEATFGVASRSRLKRVRVTIEIGAYFRSFDVDFSGESSASGTVRETGVRALVGVTLSNADRKSRDSVAR